MSPSEGTIREADEFEEQQKAISLLQKVGNLQTISIAMSTHNVVNWRSQVLRIGDRIDKVTGKGSANCYIGPGDRFTCYTQRQ